jgi:hypothetical protein
VTSGKRGVEIWDGLTVVDEVHGDDWYEPGTGMVLALLLVACAAVALVTLPAAISLGLLPARAGELAIGVLGLAVGIGGVLGVLRWGAGAWEIGLRVLAWRPAGLDVTTAD